MNEEENDLTFDDLEGIVPDHLMKIIWKDAITVQVFKNPDNFVEWQKKCVCDFENNNNTHSLTCKSRWQKIMVIDNVE